MNKLQISKFLDSQTKKSNRNIVIVDFANVDRWQDSLSWPVSINKLGKLVSHLSKEIFFVEDFEYRLNLHRT